MTTTTALLSTPFARRGVLKLAFSAAAVAIGGVALRETASARSGGALRTTTYLNFREEANSSARVIAVLPPDTEVANLGERKNGYLAVSYDGQSGWAYEEYLAYVADPGGMTPDVIGTAVVSSAVNFRTGPSTSHQVIDVLSTGTVVEITDTLQDGFRYIVYDGMAGWVYDDFLTQDGGGSSDPGVFTTTTAVNLRASSNTNSRVIMVVPAGATVIDYDFVMENGFRGVDYNGTVGWIYDDYLTQ